MLVPLLVDKDKVGPSSLRAIKSMMVMQPPPTFQVNALSSFKSPMAAKCDCQLV